MGVRRAVFNGRPGRKAKRVDSVVERFSGITVRLTVIALVMAALSACSPNLATRGSIPEESQLSLITPGVHGPDDVRAILGSPSTVSTFDDNTWYYIGRRTRQYAFFKRKILEQQVVIIQFDRSGQVQQLARLDQTNGRKIDLVERETPSAGRKLGILEQLFGNVGRFANSEGEQ